MTQKDGGTDRKEYMMMMIKKCLMAALLLGTAGAGVFAQSTVTLDEAIRLGADGISGALPRGTKIAVLNFSSSAKQTAAYVIEELNDALVKKGTLTVVDRQNLAAIRKEISFNDSKEVGNSTAQQIGRKLGAQVIVNGSLTKTGGSYRFLVQALDTETAAVKYSASFSIEEDALFKNMEGSGDYTAGERAGAVALNLLLCTGSFIVQRDFIAGSVCGLAEVTGLTAIILGAWYTDLNSDLEIKTVSDFAHGLFWTGVGLYAGGFVVSSIRALTVHKKGYVAAADNPLPFEVALVPAHTQDGLGLRVSYTYSY